VVFGDPKKEVLFTNSFAKEKEFGQWANHLRESEKSHPLKLPMKRRGKRNQKGAREIELSQHRGVERLE